LRGSATDFVCLRLARVLAIEVVKADDLITELGDAGPPGWRAKEEIQ
jgi:hypothetical protein